MKIEKFLLVVVATFWMASRSLEASSPSITFSKANQGNLEAQQKQDFSQKMEAFLSDRAYIECKSDTSYSSRNSLEWTIHPLDFHPEGQYVVSLTRNGKILESSWLIEPVYVGRDAMNLIHSVHFSSDSIDGEHKFNMRFGFGHHNDSPFVDFLFPASLMSARVVEPNRKPYSLGAFYSYCKIEVFKPTNTSVAL